MQNHPLPNRKYENPKELFQSRVIVELFPSRVELYQLLDKFIQNNNYDKDYTSDNRDNIVHFMFKNPVRIMIT